MAGRRRQPDLANMPLDTFTTAQLEQFMERFKFSEEHAQFLDRIYIEVTDRKLYDNFSEIEALKTCKNKQLDGVWNDIFVVVSCQ